MMTMAPVTVRRAELGDYEAVLDINRNVYVGFDYLPALYFTYFHDNNHVIYLLEQQGQLISLVNYELSTDRTHVTTMSSRVRPSHQGQGLSVERSAELKARLRSEYSQVTHEMYAAVVTERTDKKISQSTTLFRWRTNGYQTTMANILPHLQTCTRSSGAGLGGSCYCLTELSYSTSIDWLSNTSIIQAFLRQYTTEYIPVASTWRLVSVNSARELKSVFAGGRVFVSRRDQKQERDITEDSDKICALSFCHVIRADVGCRLDMYYYGDVTELCTHVTAQLCHAATIWDKDIGFLLHFSQDLEFDRVEEILSDVGLTKEKSVEYFKHIESVLGVKKLNF